MQLKIYIDLKKEELQLPINYNHILQGIIYSSLSKDSKYQTLLHNFGITELSNFKLFTFSSLCGKHYVENKKITFVEKIFWEIRSVDSYFIFLLYEYFKSNGITFGKRVVYPQLNIENKIIREESITIKMNSPICIPQKLEDNKINYLSPRDDDFEKYVNNNFIKKYSSYYNTEPNINLEITNIELSHKDKMVTSLKGTYITAWKGKYILTSSPDYLTFLYNSGLGAKNSQGFGLFEITESTSS